MLSKAQIEDIDYSWEIICENPDTMIRLYDHFFDLSPEAVHFFPDDLSKQSEKLAYTIGFVVSNLDRLETIKETIQDLGRFHNQLNIDAYHYENLKVAFNLTVREVMKDRYHENIGDAWNIALSCLSQWMLNAPRKKKRSIKILMDKLFDKNLRNES